MMSNDNMQHGGLHPLSQDAQLINDIARIVEQARQRVRTAVNTAMVYAYFEIGRHIVEYEQGGNTRADYGKRLLNELSAALTARLGDGWGYPQLNNIRRFYLVYSAKMLSPWNRNAKEISGVDSSEREVGEFSTHCIENSKTGAVSPVFVLSWSHYLILMRIKDTCVPKIEFVFFYALIGNR